MWLILHLLWSTNTPCVGDYWILNGTANILLCILKYNLLYETKHRAASLWWLSYLFKETRRLIVSFFPVVTHRNVCNVYCFVHRFAQQILVAMLHGQISHKLSFQISTVSSQLLVMDCTRIMYFWIFDSLDVLMCGRMFSIVKLCRAATIDNRIYNSRLNTPYQLRRRKCPQFSRDKKWRTLQKTDCYWAEEYATSQLHKRK